MFTEFGLDFAATHVISKITSAGGEIAEVQL
jgi:hypothetical protein